jgi:methylenetetrahydrofolate reductase (NADPH)
VTPEADIPELQILKMEKKIEAGAKFFQTQAVYDPQQFECFMNMVQSFKIPVLAGLVVLKSPGMARYMNENVAGVNVPEGIIQEMEETAKNDRKKKSVEITARIIRQVKPFCQGVHIMPLGWDELIPDIVNSSELI